MKNPNRKETVIVFGYSDNPDRYSNIAFNLLKEYQHAVIAYNPRETDQEKLPKECDTVTLYMSSAISDKFSDVMMNIDFKRLIVNPGAENPGLEKKLMEKGVEVVHGCTLVMLRTNQF